MSLDQGTDRKLLSSCYVHVDTLTRTSGKEPGVAFSLIVFLSLSTTSGVVEVKAEIYRAFPSIKAIQKGLKMAYRNDYIIENRTA